MQEVDHALLPLPIHDQKDHRKDCEALHESKSNDTVVAEENHTDTEDNSSDQEYKRMDHCDVVLVGKLQITEQSFVAWFEHDQIFEIQPLDSFNLTN